MMDVTLPLLRIIHLLAGSFWLGVGLFSVLFLTPVVRRTGQQGQGVMSHLIGQTQFPRVMGLAALLTILSGAPLYWRVSSHLDTHWLETPSGIALTFGMTAGILAYTVSALVQSRAASELTRIGNAIAGSGQPPLTEQLERVQVLQRRLTQGAQATAVLMVVAIAAMGAWRYIY